MSRHQDRHQHAHAPEETHPAWGVIGVNTISSSHGVPLFDSDIRHQRFVEITLQHAVQRRMVMRRWIGARKRIVQVWMSQAQWGAFVSSFGHGDGVPCTISWLDGDVEPPPQDGRLQENFRQVREASNDAIEDVREAFGEYVEAVSSGAAASKRKDLLGTLRARIDNLPTNMAYAAKTLAETAEDVVTKAKADIEAMVVMKAAALGLDASATMAILHDETAVDAIETGATDV